MNDLHLDLDQLLRRLDCRECVANRQFGGSELSCLAREVVLLRTFRRDCTDHAQRDIAAHRFVDGPQRSTHCSSRAVDTNDDRR
jgi:hypothetical protein